MIDPDPLNPADVDAAYEQGWVDGHAHSMVLEAARKRRRDHLGIAAVLAAAAALFTVDWLAGRASAAPRSGPEQPASTGRASAQVQTGAPSVPASQVSGLPSARPSVESGGTPGAPTPSLPSSTARAGVASFVAPSYGGRYLALPAGPGHRVQICGPAACVVRTSTDAGPDRQRQREGRVADLSFEDFRRLCACNPWTLGLLPVTVQALP